MTPDDVVARAEADGVRLVRFLYVDPDGIIRGKNVHVGRLAGKLREGLGLTRAMNAMTMQDQLADVDGMPPVGEIRLLPDPDTYSVLPWVDRTASLICDELEQDFEPWAGGTRVFLRRAIAAAEARGIRVMAAFENEFYLAQDRDGTLVPWGNGPVYSSAGMDRPSAVMHDIVDALEAQGIEVEQAINEYGTGQQEIAVRYRDALAAADMQVKFRDTVRGVAEMQHGLVASFAAKPFGDDIGSGAHIHFSLWSASGGTNLLYDPDAGDALVSRVGRAFVAGILDHLPALVALTCPSFNSYERLAPDAWSGSTISWGPDNRECPVRVVSPFRGREAESTNLELKASDPSSNPYLALGGLILAGLDGIDRGLEPPEPVLVNPSRLSADEREARGIRDLPGSLREAMANLAADRVLMAGLGDLLGRCYLAVKAADADAFEAMTPDAARAAHQRVF